MAVSVLTFRTVPTTLLVIIIYAAIFFSVYITDQLPNIPKSQAGLDFAEAYSDLQHIAAQPHPYNSHLNDEVRGYILSRLNSIAKPHPHVHVVNDLSSTAIRNTSCCGVYFEGSNILVKVDGQEKSYEDSGRAVLFSAHFDSVATASGAADDGMGLVTLIQLVKYFAEHRQKRTVVFNFNNGEEDGLNGAYAFFAHPWSNLTDTFLNLEGGASGGRPMLFRSTSITPLRSYRHRNVPHPHTSVLSADAFAAGLVKSRTDYSVYADGGKEIFRERNYGKQMEGLDLAFYKGRSFYHTKYDAMPFTCGGEKSLWSMMEAAKGLGSALAMAAESGEGEKAVYFDLFATSLVLFSLNSLFLFNVLTLVIGPLVLLLLLFIVCKRQQDHRALHDEAPLSESNEKHFLSTAWSLSQFWVVLLLVIVLQAILVSIFVKVDPFIIHSSPYTILFAMISLAYVVFFVFFSPLLSHLSLSQTALPSPSTQIADIPTRQQKHVLFIHLYIFTYILLVLSTVGITRFGIGGTYPISAWHAGVWIACILGLLSKILSGASATDSVTSVSQEPSETTPLVEPVSRNGRGPFVVERSNNEVLGLWALQLLLTVPFPLVLFAHLGVVLMDSLPQTAVDGGGVIGVYIMLCLLSLMIILPLVPFIHKMHRWIAYVFILVFVITILLGSLSFPFSQSAPVKLFFAHEISLGGLVPGSKADLGLSYIESNDFSMRITMMNATTTLTGVAPFLEQSIIPYIPSTKGNKVDCHPSDEGVEQGGERKGKGEGLQICSWNSGLPASPGGKWGGNGEKRVSNSTGTYENIDKWLRAEVHQTGFSSLRVKVQGRNTRACRVHIPGRRILRWSVQFEDESQQKRRHDQVPLSQESEIGLDEVRLWSRTRGREFVLDLELKQNPENNKEVAGTVMCEWDEYESAMVDQGNGIYPKSHVDGAKIPALEEVLTFIPPWAVVTKSGNGLMRVSRRFTI